MLFQTTSLSEAQTQSGWFLPLMALLLCAHLFVGPIQNLALFYDEAYYRFWSLTPDWGYYSKPPMVAWLIATTTNIGGNNEWMIRISSPLLYAGAAGFIYLIAQSLYKNDAIAKAASLIFFSSPIVTFNSLFITTDAPLLFFWSAGIYCFVKATDTDYRNDSTKVRRWWFAFGICIGLGLLSKYTMAVLPGSLGLFMLSQARYRNRQCVTGVLMSLFVALLLFSPNLWWNYQHDFISFQHTSEISKLQQKLFHPDKFAEFFGSQFFTFGPPALALLLYLSATYFKDRGKKDCHTALLIWTALPMLIIICIQALLAKANMNWAAPAYISASILVAVWVIQNRKPGWLKGIVIINLVLASAFYTWPQLQKITGIQPSTRNTPYHRVSGWRELALQVPSLSVNEAYLSNSRAVLSYLSYYAKNNHDAPALMAFNPDGHIDDHFDLMHSLSETNQASGYLFVTEKPMDLTRCFQSIKTLPPITQQVYPSLTRTWYLYKLSGFNGYENCN
ncbi:glycosyltransferase family 39 protein [Aestuariibacter sp. GS-14]|uniref:ArnT family glycosyltransferase n=1 Tax=Aestuariibacter sp. GS-14 TaxID=2590670 RepID=UPI00112CE605|nr:glycosyltransferase family 39 protein [Aestuariibacter sp. GS-14]TPV58554.1 glycosyltransferase family 39 protein [Aestuariibacter sp. GS-14]